MCHLGDFQSPNFPNMGVLPAVIPRLSTVTEFTCLWGVPALNTRCGNWLPWKISHAFSSTRCHSGWHLEILYDLTFSLVPLTQRCIINLTTISTKYIDHLSPLASFLHIYRRTQLKYCPRDWLFWLRFLCAFLQSHQANTGTISQINHLL
jgi:hypothetical protein